MIEYGDENLLMLSGIQHFAFCKRQWALIHIEQQWDENRFTVEGNRMHKNVDMPDFITKRNDTVTLRSVPLVSRRLGLYGVSDVVEMKAAVNGDNAIRHPEYDGWWHLMPVEYKRGKPKEDERDIVQLCAQALCLEEMYGVHIEKGYFYYGETRRREEINFSIAIRNLVNDMAAQMHELYDTGATPLPVYKSHCRSCSLTEICMPKQLAKGVSANEYLRILTDDRL